MKPNQDFRAKVVASSEDMVECNRWEQRKMRLVWSTKVP